MRAPPGRLRDLPAPGDGGQPDELDSLGRSEPPAPEALPQRPGAHWHGARPAESGLELHRRASKAGPGDQAEGSCAEAQDERGALDASEGLDLLR